MANKVKVAPSKTNASVAPSATRAVIAVVPIESVWELLLAWQQTEKVVVLHG